jgi:hypothetical protein
VADGMTMRMMMVMMMMMMMMLILDGLMEVVMVVFFGGGNGGHCGLRTTGPHCYTSHGHDDDLFTPKTWTASPKSQLAPLL